MNFNLLNKLILLLSACIFVVPSHATDNKLKPCDTLKHRAFDFWLGEWEVSSPKQKTPPSSSSITLSNDGCSIHERYETAGKFTGNSINFYDSKSNKWHQTWIDNQGNPLYLDGEFNNGSMVLSDDNNRITWTLLKNKQVNQVWETSADKGKPWKTIFNGFYTKK